MNDMVSIRKMRPLGLAGIFTADDGEATGVSARGSAAGAALSAALDDDVFRGAKLLV
jgi:hypothetical protein